MTFHGTMIGVVFCGLLVTSAGCVNTPTFGDRISAHGAATADLGSDWNRGDSMVKKGTKLRKESEGLAAKSKKKQSESDELLSEGKKLMRESEVAYQSEFGTSTR